MLKRVVVIALVLSALGQALPVNAWAMGNGGDDPRCVRVFDQVYCV
jgi:hypothetical protein